MKRAPIPTARFRFAAVAVGTTVYAFGGHDTCELTGSYTETLCHESVVTNSEAYFAIERPHLWAHIDEGKAKVRDVDLRMWGGGAWVVGWFVFSLCSRFPEHAVNVHIGMRFIL